MPKTLTDEQKSWLGKALGSKGRFTTKRSVKKDLAKYIRRREKVETALAGIQETDEKIRLFIQTGLKAADKLADDGKLGAAYKALDKVKQIAKARVSKHGGKISVDLIRHGTDAIQVMYNAVKTDADLAISGLEVFMKDVKKDAGTKGHKTMSPAADSKDLAEALACLTNFVVTEATLRVDLDSHIARIDRVCAEIVFNKIPDQIKTVYTDISAMEAVGHGDAVAFEAQRLDILDKNCQEKNKLYLDTTRLKGIAQTKREEFEKIIAGIKSLDSFQKRGERGERPRKKDQQTKDARGKLKRTDNAMALLMKEEDRVKIAMAQMDRDIYVDSSLRTNTGRGPIEVAVEPDTYDPQDMLDDFFGDDGLPDDITKDEIADYARKAGKGMENFLRGIDPNDGAQSDELLDLMLQTEEDLAKTIGEKLGGSGLDREALLAQMAAEMKRAVLEKSPNKIDDDLKEMDFQGGHYKLEKVLGKGGLGIARRYRETTTGETICVKTLIKSDDREGMVEEMRTHRRVLNGDNNVPGDENILSMKGAAVSPNGSLHMVMEDAAGGDLTSVGRNLLVMVDRGLIPEAARTALAQDLIAQTARGLMALENRGLVHNDLKPGNMLLMADGTVKIMDFGESRFGDESGETPSARTVYDTPEQFGTTPGYEAPEQGVKGNVTSKVDAYALGRIVQDLGGHDRGAGWQHDIGHSFNPHKRYFEDEKPVTAKGRLVAGLLNDDPDERPSLQAILASSYMRSGRTDHNPEDVKDLKAAAADFNRHMGGLKVKITAEEAQTLYSSRHVNDRPGEISIGHSQERISEIKLEINKKQRDMAGKPAREAKQLEAEISDLLQKISGWEKRTTDVIKARHDKGEKEYQDFTNDESNTITVGSKKNPKQWSVKKALAAKQRILEEITKKQNEFYHDTNFDPSKLDGLNQELVALDKKVHQIDARIATLRDEKLGAEVKYYLAEKKLSEIAERFGPKSTGYGTRADGDDVEDDIADDVEDDVEDDVDLAASPPPPPPPPPPPKTKTA